MFLGASASEIQYSLPDDKIGGTLENLDRFAFFLHYYYQQVKMVEIRGMEEKGTGKLGKERG